MLVIAAAPRHFWINRLECLHALTSRGGRKRFRDDPLERALIVNFRQSARNIGCLINLTHVGIPDLWAPPHNQRGRQLRLPYFSATNWPRSQSILIWTPWDHLASRPS